MVHPVLRAHGMYSAWGAERKSCVCSRVYQCMCMWSSRCLLQDAQRTVSALQGWCTVHSALYYVHYVHGAQWTVHILHVVSCTTLQAQPACTTFTLEIFTSNTGERLGAGSPEHAGKHIWTWWSLWVPSNSRNTTSCMFPLFGNCMGKSTDFLQNSWCRYHTYNTCNIPYSVRLSASVCNTVCAYIFYMHIVCFKHCQLWKGRTCTACTLLCTKMAFSNNFESEILIFLLMYSANTSWRCIKGNRVSSFSFEMCDTFLPEY